MDLEELSAFLKVVESGSFLAASDSLGVSRTTLRRRVSALEARAGVPLLESTRQGVVPTEAGQVLEKRGRTMLEEASALIASVREIGKELTGTLRLILPVGMPPQVLVPWAQLLRQTHPKLGVHAKFSNDPLAERLVDVDVVLHFGEEPPGGPWLSLVLLRVTEWLVASKDYLDRRGTPTSIEELQKHELLAWHGPFEDPRVWPTRHGTTFNVEPLIISTDIHVLRHCCVGGLGIGLMPDVLIPELGSPLDTLVPVLPELVGRQRVVRVSVPAALSDVPKIKMMLAFTRQFVRAMEIVPPRDA